MSQTRTTVVISSICAAEKKGSSYKFYFMSKILHCCTAALLSIVAALSPPPAANRFRDVIFRRRSPFVDSDFESLPQLYFPSSQPFATSSRRRSLSPPPAAGRFRDFIFRRRSLSSTPSVDAAFRRLLASTTSSSVVTAFRRLLPSTQPFVDSSLPRLHLPSSQPFVDSFRRHSLSSTPSVVAALRRLERATASGLVAGIVSFPPLGRTWNDKRTGGPGSG